MSAFSLSVSWTRFLLVSEIRHRQIRNDSAGPLPLASSCSLAMTKANLDSIILTKHFHGHREIHITRIKFVSLSSRHIVGIYIRAILVGHFDIGATT